MAKFAVSAAEIAGGVALTAFGFPQFGVPLIGMGISSALATALTPGLPKVDNARAVDARVQGSSYGVFIPRGYNTVEHAGQVIWATKEFKDTPSVTPAHGGKHPTPQTTNHIYSRSFGIQFGAAPPGGAHAVTRIKFDDKVFYQGTTTGEVVTSNMHLYMGTEDQLPNSWYEADVGMGNAPAHRGMVTGFFHDIDCSPYGDRIPQVRAEIVYTDEAGLDQIVEIECGLADLQPSDLDVTQLSSDVPDGVLITQQSPVRQSLEMLGLAHQFGGVEVDGVIRMVKRPQVSLATVPYDDLGAYEEDEAVDSDGQTPALVATRTQTLEIPKSVTVVYFDKLRDYEENSQSYSRQIFNSKGVSTQTFSLVMAPNAANRLAKIIAVTNWTERTPVKTSLPPEYAIYTPGDVLTLPTKNGKTYDVFIGKMNFAAPGVVRLEGAEQIAEAYDQVGEGDAGGDAPTGGSVDDPSDVDLWLGDYPALLDKQVARLGYYIAGRSANRRGFGVYRDLDGEGHWQALATVPSNATMGTLASSFASGSGIDVTHTFDVQLDPAQALASITDTAFTNTETANLAVIEEGSLKEVVQFRDVTDLGSDQYRCAHIKRGMRGTTPQIFTSAARFILIDDAVAFVEVNENEQGIEFNHRAPAPGQTIAEVSDVPFTWNGEIIDDTGSFTDLSSSGDVSAGGDVVAGGIIHATGKLKTDDDAEITGDAKVTSKVLATGGLGVGNSASASTPGTVVRKMQVFDASGASLGYVAIYDGII
jgi:hypothetical protein